MQQTQRYHRETTIQNEDDNTKRRERRVWRDANLELDLLETIFPKREVRYVKVLGRHYVMEL